MKELKKTYLGKYSGGGGDVSGEFSRKYNYQPGPEIEYVVNSFGFRSKEISKLKSNSINILVSGCSNTWGEGILEKNMWSTHIYKNFNSINNSINLDNISYPGSSIHSIIRNILSYINNYGSPDYIFICFPSLSRNLFFSDKKNGFVNVFLFDNYLMEPVKTQKEYNKSYIHENSILFATSLLYMLEEICNAKNIKLLWATWDKKDNTIFKNLNFNNFVDISNIDNVRLKNIEDDAYWEIAQDGIHFGAEWHKKFANILCKDLINEV